MSTRRLIAITAALSLPLVLAACPGKDAPPIDGGADAGTAADADTGGPDAAAPDPQGKPLAYGCASGSECASGFCVDGVCCDSACDGQCVNCRLAGAAGHCAGQLSGDDTAAAIPCEGAKTCGLDLASPTLAGCKLRNQQKCSAAGDCASLNCATYFEDLDGDGYGSANTLTLCEDAGAAAPPGYSTVSGDCCDHDAYANPGQTAYFTTPNVCGSWDYNCDGTIEPAFACPGSPAPTVCGTKPPTSGPVSCIAVHPDSTHCH